MSSPESIKYLNLAEFIPQTDKFRSHSQMGEDGGFGPDGLTGAEQRLLQRSQTFSAGTPNLAPKSVIESESGRQNRGASRTNETPLQL